jgi:general secretion pathway protein M
LGPLIGRPVSRIAALALLATICLAFYQLFVAPVLTGYSEVGRRIDNSQALLGRYRELSTEGRELSAHLQAARDAVADSITYLEGTSHTLAGAELQNMMRNLLERAGGELWSSQLLPASSNQGRASAITRVGLRVQARVGVGHLQDLLYSVETAQPSIFIDKITITAGRSDERDVEANLTVEVTVEVYGFRGEESTRLPEESAVQILRPRSARNDGQAFSDSLSRR